MTISYEHNNLSNLDSLEALDGFVPSVRNLSIGHNPLKEMASLKAITSLKTGLGNLRELVTVGTPVRESEIQKRGLEGYRTCVDSIVYMPTARAAILGLTCVPSACVRQTPELILPLPEYARRRADLWPDVRPRGRCDPDGAGPAAGDQDGQQQRDGCLPARAGLPDGDRPKCDRRRRDVRQRLPGKVRFPPHMTEVAWIQRWT